MVVPLDGSGQHAVASEGSALDCSQRSLADHAGNKQYEKARVKSDVCAPLPHSFSLSSCISARTAQRNNAERAALNLNL